MTTKEKRIANQTLTLVRVIKVEQKHKPNSDERRRLNWKLCQYRGDIDGGEYRKAFESYGDPIAPETGTHKSLAAACRQY